MESVTQLRDAARAALLSCGGRGFVRFLSEGDALLVSDANRRGDPAALIAALSSAGFLAEERDGLLHIVPGDALLYALCSAQPEEIAVDWESPLFEAMALCNRLMRQAPLPLDAGGRRLVIETARLIWQPEEKVLSGLDSLRAMIAVRLREGKRSGLNEAGRLLCGWLAENTK